MRHANLMAAVTAAIAVSVNGVWLATNAMHMPVRASTALNTSESEGTSRQHPTVVRVEPGSANAVELPTERILVWANGQTCKRLIRFQNDTGTSLTLRPTQRSCSCVVADAPDVIAPRGTGDIEISTELPMSQGAKRVVVSWADSTDPSLSANVSWTIEHYPALEVSPMPAIDVGAADAVFKTSVISRRESGSDVGDISMDSSDAWLISAIRGKTVRNSDWDETTWDMEIGIKKDPGGTTGGPMERIGHFELTDGRATLRSSFRKRLNSSFRNLPHSIILRWSATNLESRSVEIQLADDVTNVDAVPSSSVIVVTEQTCDAAAHRLRVRVSPSAAAPEGRVTRSSIRLVPHERPEQVAEVPVIVLNDRGHNVGGE